MSARSHTVGDRRPRALSPLVLLPAAGVLFAISIKAGPLALIAFGIVPLAVAAVLRFPFLLSALFFVDSSFRLHDIWPALEGIRLPLMLGAGAAAGLVAKAMTDESCCLHLPRQMYFFFATAIIVSIGVPFAQEKVVSIGVFTNGYIKIILGLIFFVWLGRSVDDVKQSFALMMGSGVLLSLFLVYRSAYKIDLVEGTRAVVLSGVETLLSDPNDVAAFLVPVLAIAIVLAKECRAWRLLASATAVTVLLGIMATQSRGGALGVLTVTGYLGLRWIKPKILLVPILATAAIALILAGGLLSRSSGGLDSIGVHGIDDSAADRLVAWKAAINMAIQHPVVGIGIGGFHSMFFYYTDVWLHRNMAVHSSWFQVLGESGCISLVAFFGLIATTFISLLRTEQLQIPARPSQNLIRFRAGLLVVLTSFIAASAGLAYYFDSWPSDTPSYLTPLPALINVLTVIAGCAAVGSLLWEENAKRRAAKASSDMGEVPAISLALQAALLGYCASVSMVTHAFHWYFYLLIGLSVILEKTLRYRPQYTSMS